MKLAYLVSRYPAVSHTFITREIAALRRLGLEVQPFTIRAAGEGDLLTPAVRDEARRTTAILPAGPLRLMRAHLGLILARPADYFGALRVALTRCPPNVRAAVWHMFYFLEAGLLAAELRSRNIDHIHAHFANVASEVAMLSAQMAGKSWSMTLHGLSDFGNPALNDLGFKVEHAAFVVCVSDFGRAQAMLHSDPSTWDRIHRIRCGIETEVFGRRGPHPASAGPLRLLHVGRLGREKGQAILLRAVAELIARGIDVRCTIVGDGPQRTRLEVLSRELDIESRVVFAGAVGEHALQSYYQDADIFVMPSFAEGLPVVLMEAMAMGVPVIASHIMGIPELVEHGVCGLLVPPGRVTELADAIAGLARDPDLRVRFAAAGRLKVCRDFDTRASSAALAELFRAGLTQEPRATDSPEPAVPAHCREASGVAR